MCSPFGPHFSHSRLMMGAVVGRRMASAAHQRAAAGGVKDAQSGYRKRTGRNRKGDRTGERRKGLRARFQPSWSRLESGKQKV